MCRVSVVVPVYNSEEKLQRCIHSILEQRGCSFELILVDDGSMDQSGAICDAAAENDDRIKVIHQRNAGAAAARNAGIRAACGEFIAFCDADDKVSDRWLARMLRYADENVLPIGGYCGKEDDLQKAAKLDVQSGQRYPAKCYWEFQKSGLAGYLCNALYSRKVLTENNLLIPERRELNDINEDLSFALDYVGHVKYLVFTGYLDYFYDTHGGSLSQSANELYFCKFSEKYRLWRAFLITQERYDAETMTDLANIYTYHFLTALHYESKNGNYGKFKKIVLSNELQACIGCTNTEKENKRILALIKRKKVILLWCYLLAAKIKGGFGR